MDKYYEQLTQAYRSPLHAVYTVLIYICAAFFLLTLFSLALFANIGVGIIIAAFFLGIGILSFFQKQKKYVEYEYIFTSGDVDIDRITEAKKRKRVISFNVSDLYMLAPEGSYYLDGTPEGKKVIAYPKNSSEKKYIAIVNKNGAVNHIYFIPDEEFIDACFRSNPRNVKKL